MYRSMSQTEAYMYDDDFRQRAREQYELLRKNCDRIKRIALKQISYDDMPVPFDYVYKLFPYTDVKDVGIYKVARRDLDKMGFVGAEGFHDTISKMVVVSGASRSSSRRSVNRKYNVVAKVSTDEVIVHELCHYCHTKMGRRSESRTILEEFAYGWSLGYLRQKGHSDKDIIEFNYLPFLFGESMNEATINILARNEIGVDEYNAFSSYRKKECSRKYGSQIFLRAKELAMEKGWKIVEVYSKKLEEIDTEVPYVESTEEVDRFDLLDI